MPRHPSAEAAPPLDEYFEQQAALFRHLEKRFNKFNKEATAQARRARESKRKHKNTPAPTKHQHQHEQQHNMLSSKSLAQVIRPAVLTSVSPASASFSTSASASARAVSTRSRLQKKVTKPNVMNLAEAARVLGALEVSHPTATYSLTLTTKSHKSALPIRGSFILPLDPRRTSETILVFADPNSESAAMAIEAGAAHVGGEEIFESVLSGKIQPTRVLATPGLMPPLTKALARYLGPKGLMPVAKRGNVAEGEELVERIKEAAGKMEYRADKLGTVIVSIARSTFAFSAVEGNVKSFIKTVRDNQAAANSTDDPLAAAGKSKKKKGSQITTALLGSTNGPVIEISNVL